MKPPPGYWIAWMNDHCQFSSKRGIRPTSIDDVKKGIIHVSLQICMKFEIIFMKFSKIVLDDNHWSDCLLFYFSWILVRSKSRLWRLKMNLWSLKVTLLFHHQYIFVSNWVIEIPNCIWFKTSKKFHAFYHLWICWL